ACRTCTRGQIEIEVDLVPALYLRHSGVSPDLWDVLAGVDLIIGRQVPPEGDLAHRTGGIPKHPDRKFERSAFRGVVPRLLVDRDARHRVQREDGSRLAGTKSEVGRRWGGGVDLVADLLQYCRGAHRREYTGRHDLALRDAELVGRLHGIQQIV